MSTKQNSAIVANGYRRILDTYRRFIVSETFVVLAWWHFALLVPTIGFKYLYVRRMSFTEGLRTILESMGYGLTGGQ